MSKLTIVAKIIAKAEKIDFVKAELLKLIPPTLAEAGCINYDLHQDNEHPNIFLFHENWESRDLWQNHMNNTHLAEFTKAIDGAIEAITVSEMTPIS